MQRWETVQAQKASAYVSFIRRPADTVLLSSTDARQGQIKISSHWKEQEMD